jgi:hypothetical protein
MGFWDFNVSGRVISQNGKGLGDVKIYSSGTVISDISAKNGEFNLELKGIVPAQEIFFWFERIGYLPKHYILGLDPDKNSYPIRTIALQGHEIEVINLDIFVVDSTRLMFSNSRVSDVRVLVQNELMGITDKFGKLEVNIPRPESRKKLNIVFQKQSYEAASTILQLTDNLKYKIIQNLTPPNRRITVSVFSEYENPVENATIKFGYKRIASTNREGHAYISFRPLPDDTIQISLPSSYSPVDTFLVFEESIKDYQLKIRERITYGTLSLTSTPIGADVYIDGLDEVPRKTPVDNITLPFGTYRLRLGFKGYEQHSTLVEVKKNQNTNLGNINLTELKGTLAVSTQTDDADKSADIYIDGMSVGRLDSLTGSFSISYPIGSYQLTIHKQNYDIFEIAVSVRGNEITKVLYTPKAITRDIFIIAFFESSPKTKKVISVDRIMMDGKSVEFFEIEKTQRIMVPNVKLGPHTILPQRRGFSARPKEVAITSKGSNEFEIMLEKRQDFLRSIMEAFGHPTSVNFEYYFVHPERQLLNMAKTKTHFRSYFQPVLTFRQDSLFTNHFNLQTEFLFPSISGLGITLQPSYRVYNSNSMSISTYVALSSASFGVGIEDQWNGFVKLKIGAILKLGNQEYFSLKASRLDYLWMPYLNTDNKIENFIASGVQVESEITVPQKVIGRFELLGWLEDWIPTLKSVIPRLPIDPVHWPVQYRYIYVNDENDMSIQKHQIGIGYRF